MANYTENFNSKLDWAMPFQRTGAFPIDRTSLFSSYADAVKYAAGNPNDPDSRGLCGSSYVGQTITVFENDTVEKYDIQFLCVDQYSLLEDERKAYAPNEQMANLSKDLVALQKLKRIPILSASQQNRTEVDKDGPTTRNISGSDRIGHDATTVLFIERKSADQVTFVVGKARNGRTGDKLTYFWQINTGQLIYMPTDKDAKKGEESEQVEQSYNDTEKSNSVF